MRLEIRRQNFLAKASKMWNNSYLYDEVQYFNAHTPIVVTCPEHGNFSVTANNHLCKLRGQGCPECNKGGFNVSKPAIAYYLKIESSKGTAWKIGVTNRSVDSRYVGEMHKITLITTWVFETGRQAKDFENTILKEHKDFKYQGPKLLKSGWTEMFNKNILKD